MKLRLIAIIILAGAFLVSCNNKYPGYSKTNTGLYYKSIVDAGDTLRPVDGDVMTVLMNYYSQNDSLLYHSDMAGGPIQIIMTEMFPGDIYEGLAMMGKGDSMHFMVRADSLVAQNLLTKDIGEEGHIRFEVKMIDIMRAADFKYQQELQRQQMEAELDEMRDMETEDLDTYLEKNSGFKGPKGDGYYIKHTKRGLGAKVKEGMVMVAEFDCKLVNDIQIASTANSGDMLEYEAGSNNFFAKWDEAIMELRKGSEATIIIPSSMAFGREGGGNGSIPPYASLFFDVKVKDVISKEELESRKAKEQEVFKLQEKSERDNYLSQNGITASPTESGLYYIPTVEGTGAQAGFGSTVKVHYTGRNLKGEVFDSSVERNEPIEFVLGMGQVIKGWDEGIGMMKVGGKATLVIPSDLAYGNNARGPQIPPYSTLVFDVELLEVK